MRVFVDVGAHYGETLDVALDPRWAFDRVFSLEPSQDCQRLLRLFRDERITLVGRGLSDATRVAELYGAGLLGGSVYADKPQGSVSAPEIISLIRASDWLSENTSSKDIVFLKLNCEGSEADILDDLLKSDVLSRIESVYVDFDIRKIPSQAHRQVEIETRLRDAGASYVTPDDCGAAGNPAVAIWLERTSEMFPVSPGAKVRHLLRLYLPLYLLAKAVAGRILPRPVFSWLGESFGRQRRRG
jgi:FkbM family methyltransferase